MNRHIQRAILSYQTVKQTAKTLENKALNATGVDKKMLGLLGAIHRIGSTQAIDTRQLKYKVNVGGVNTKPYVFYNYGGSSLEVGFNINIDF